ncbi:hypothetical protein N799_01315 [Lysobacter arseniciresistens ZS79]|uniref:Uncharacterized protein n=1 Tax=Lysobacter arseniciresistens ZS79 TaxID=913325 RepID=A0A0A0F654_9GAMM|nr:hypothetical protein N799_01315 [Lysobacter arseniciresistens ZS79]
MHQRFSVFEYQYRDAGNWKTAGTLLLTGASDDADTTIRNSLEWADQFVAEQVGVPSLCPKHFESTGDGPSDLDHAYHEFVRLRTATPADLSLPPAGDLPDLVKRFRAAANRWDVTLSPNCDL